MVAWAVDDGEPFLWDAKKEKYMPPGLRDLLRGNQPICCHNSQFEMAIFNSDIVGVTIDPKRWRCSMARAYAHGLPGSLDSLSTILGLPQDQKKSKEGYDLIRLFCIPPGKNVKRGRATYQTHPAQWEKFKDYCKQDIVAAREVWKRLPEWNYKGFELDLWHLDQKINQRGLCIDVELAQAAIRAVDKAQIDLKRRTVDLTLGDVSSATKRDQMLQHILATYGVELPDMQASTLERRIEDPDLPEPLRELLAIRLQATTSSTAKYKKVMACVSSDGRLRGTLQWCGASRTGRDGGRLLQPQNLPKPTMKNPDIELGIEALKHDCADILYPNVMSLASNTIRGLITAAPGHKLLIADLSNIEGRYAAWLAGEEWKLKAFRDYDTILGKDEKGKPIRKGFDLYILAFARAFNIKPEQVTKKQRDEIGKTMELALQFGGGVGAFVTFALNFGINLEDLVRDAWDQIPQTIRAESNDFWKYAEKQKRTLGLEKDVFITCDSLKRLWRQAHPNIVQTWADIQQGLVESITTKDTTFIHDQLKFRRSGNWLRVQMPSGRSLCYPHPQVNDKGEVSFMGVDQYTRKFQRIDTYGPKVFENGVQGGARDVFMYGVRNAEAAGYPVVSRIHDEQVDEVPDTDDYTAEELCTLMTTNIPWCEGLPLAAAGFESYRYRKGD